MKEVCVIHSGKITRSLKAGKLKVTPIRVALLDALEHAAAPVRVKDLVKKAGSDIVTIYRNIENLIKLGLVQQVFLDQKEAYFELTGKTHHHHAICESCGRVVDVKDLGHRKIELQAKKMSGFASIDRHSLEFFGTCKSCASKIAGSK